MNRGNYSPFFSIVVAGFVAASLLTCGRPIYAAGTLFVADTTNGPTDLIHAFDATSGAAIAPDISLLGVTGTNNWAERKFVRGDEQSRISIGSGECVSIQPGDACESWRPLRHVQWPERRTRCARAGRNAIRRDGEFVYCRRDGIRMCMFMDRRTIR